MSFTEVMRRIRSSQVSYAKPRQLGKPKKPRINLHGYQYESVKFGLSRPAAGFFLAPGLGKTLIILMIFKILKKLGLVDELIVVAKRRIIYNTWPKELKKWKLGFTWDIVHGPRKLQALQSDADVRMINYEGLPWLAKQKWFFRRGKKLMLACDESSKLRHTSTVRFRSLKKILKLFARRYILTGSPAPNGMMNLFGQAYVLDLGEALGSFITQFRNEYFYPSGYMGYEWKLMKGARERIFEKLRPLVIRYGTDQLKMPPLTFVKRYVYLPTEVRVQYKKLEKELLLEYKEGDVVAANAAVASGKLRQVANGHVYYSGNQIVDELPEKRRKGKLQPWRVMHDEKCEELVELLEELNGEPALVAYEFAHDKAHIQDYFKRHAPQFKNAPFIGGGTKDAVVEKYLAQWDRGELPVMFGHPDSVAHGLNLQEGRGGIVIFFALTWNLENFEQFIQRVWRQGQKRRVIVYLIMARGTVDEDIMTSIEVKDHDQTTLLEAMGRRVEKKLSL